MEINNKSMAAAAVGMRWSTRMKSTTRAFKVDTWPQNTAHYLWYYYRFLTALRGRVPVSNAILKENIGKMAKFVASLRSEDSDTEGGVASKGATKDGVKDEVKDEAKGDAKKEVKDESKDGVKDGAKDESKDDTNDDTKFGILLMGNSGTGKTTLLYALQQYYRRVKYYRKEASPLLRVVMAKEIRDEDDSCKRIKNLCAEPLLGIDDFGAEPTENLVFGSVATPLTDLLEYRYDRQLFTVLTTNLSPAEIKAKYGNRIADRFREMFLKLIFNYQSFR